MKEYNQDVEVCFITTTQYHFLLSDIYSRYLYDKYGIRPIVLYREFKNFDISKFDTEGKYEVLPYKIKNQSIIGQCIFALQCGYLFPLYPWRKLLNEKKKIILYIFTDTSKLSNRMIEEVKRIDQNNKVYLIDEGTGTYMDSLDLKNERLWRLKHRISKILFGNGRTSVVIGENPLIDGAIVRNPENYKKLKKSEKQDVVKQSPVLLDQSYMFIQHYSAVSKMKFDCDVLYLGQSYYRNGRYYRDEEKCISEILSALPKETKVLIKPHPRDHVGKYRNIEANHDNVTIIADDLATIPIETMIELTNARVVVCIQSTAAVTLADMYPKLTSIVLKKTPECKSFLRKLKETGEEVPEFDDEYFKGINRNIFCPNSLAECANIVTKRISSIFEKKEPKDRHDMVLEEMDYVLLRTNIADIDS